MAKRSKARKTDTEEDSSASPACTSTKEITSAAITLSSRHAFPTNSLDHCETPLRAYQHIAPVLETIANRLNLQPSKLRIYDPYYCDGSMKQHLSTLGYTRVIHFNVDFYHQIQNKSIPEHDVLLTNPPYSEDHIEKLLQFVTTSNNDKPFLLLMPNWVARKSEYNSLMGNVPHFFLSPVKPYTYTMPLWNEDKPDHVQENGETTPYLSSWYISLNCSEMELGEVERRLDGIAKKKKGEEMGWVVAKTVKGLKWKIQKVNKKKR
ncbi:hypothetical protein ACHAWO_003280 [Cyclotella atomus]|uniref:Uncharacterized protein n=1 Tax=Cyclotella atomus TaxID=382360 RepID=A0ABD3N068_9STRA